MEARKTPRASADVRSIRRIESSFGAFRGSVDSQRLWCKASHKLDRNPLSDARVVLVGFDAAELLTVRDQLRNIGVRATAAFKDVRQIEDIISLGGAFNGMVVNLEAFPDAETAIGDLMTFRHRSPHLTVLLVSSCVGQDDFGTDRRLICDVTLRRPVTEGRLRDALMAGLSRVIPVRRTGGGQ